MQYTQANTTSTEFLKWIWFLDWDEFERQKSQNYYLAQIAAGIDRGLVKNPNKVTIKSRIIHFNSKSKTLSPKVTLQNSQNYWKGLVGVSKNKQNQKRKKIPKKVRFKNKE